MAMGTGRGEGGRTPDGEGRGYGGFFGSHKTLSGEARGGHEAARGAPSGRGAARGHGSIVNTIEDAKGPTGWESLKKNIRLGMDMTGPLWIWDWVKI